MGWVGEWVGEWVGVAGGEGLVTRGKRYSCNSKLTIDKFAEKNNND